MKKVADLVAVVRREQRHAAASSSILSSIDLLRNARKHTVATPDAVVPALKHPLDTVLLQAFWTGQR